MVKDFFHAAVDIFISMYHDFLTGDLFIQIILLFLGLLILSLVLLPIVLLLIYLCENRKYSVFLKTKAKVISLSYRPEDIHIGTGAAISQNGSLNPVVTTTYEGEKFNVVLRSDKIGKIVVEDENLFNHVETNQKIELEYVEKYTKFFWQKDFKFEEYIPQKAYVNGKCIEL